MSTSTVLLHESSVLLVRADSEYGMGKPTHIRFLFHGVRSNIQRIDSPELHEIVATLQRGGTCGPIRFNGWSGDGPNYTHLFITPAEMYVLYVGKNQKYPVALTNERRTRLIDVLLPYVSFQPY